MIIDFKEMGQSIYAGKDSGEELRGILNLDLIDMTQEHVIVKVPSEVFSISTSYFNGLFSPSIKKLGKKNFFNKYKFEADEELINIFNIIVKNN